MFRGYPTQISFNGLHLATTVNRNATPFIDIHVTFLFAYYIVAGLGMAFNAYLVGHGTARTKQGGFHTKPIGRLRFKGDAQAAAGREEALTNLLNIMGRRQGPRSVFNIG